MSPSGNQHKLRHVFELSGARVLRVSFVDGTVFRLRGPYIVDHSIYGDSDKWCAEVVEPVSGSHPDFMRLHRPGNFLDFVESDIAAVRDDQSSQLLHERQEIVSR
jgi:hypothetical protein